MGIDGYGREMTIGIDVKSHNRGRQDYGGEAKRKQRKMITHTETLDSCVLFDRANE
jgi:hypothetical protein